MQNETFINPYTFFPISDEAPDRKDIDNKNVRGNLTGYIDCCMEIKSPVFIPNTTKAFINQDGHRTYEFYSYDDLHDFSKLPDSPPQSPVIPGSETRGMIRNLYEQLTNSCLSVIDENNLPYKRTNEPKMPYLLKFDTAEETWYFYKNPDLIKLSADERRETGATTSKNGKTYVCFKTGPMFKKHDTFADLGSGVKGKSISEEALARFENVILSYCESLPRIYNCYKERFYKKEPLLVYADATLTYVSPACMTKEYYVKTINEILEAQGKHQKCLDRNEACPACRLFGMIGNNGSITSRVRFSDTMTSNDCNFDIKTLPVLGQPRISATEFYLLRPTETLAAMWNYDYYTNYRDAFTNGRRKTEYVRKPYDPKLSGRKVYWHGRLQTEEVIAGKMNCTARRLISGSFTFKVFFEDVTEDELKNLLFCITLGENCQHKIGRGKPVGMGDVKLKVPVIKIRRYEFANDEIKCAWTDKNVSDYAPLPSNNEILRYTVEMTGAQRANVSYPYTYDKNNNKTKVFGWFCKNRGSVQAPKIIEVLPHIDKTPELPVTPVAANTSGRSDSFSRTGPARPSFNRPAPQQSFAQPEPGKKSVICDRCGKTWMIAQESYNMRYDRNYPMTCPECAKKK